MKKNVVPSQSYYILKSGKYVQLNYWCEIQSQKFCFYRWKITTKFQDSISKMLEKIYFYVDFRKIECTISFYLYSCMYFEIQNAVQKKFLILLKFSSIRTNKKVKWTSNPTSHLTVTLTPSPQSPPYPNLVRTFYSQFPNSLNPLFAQSPRHSHSTPCPQSNLSHPPKVGTVIFRINRDRTKEAKKFKTH